MIFKHIPLRRFSSHTKIYPSSAAALHDLQSGAQILFGGFGICGIPENLIRYIHSSNVKDIWAVSNTAGIQSFGLGTLLTAGKLKRFTASYVGENPEFERQYLQGEISVEFSPQGTLAERCRSAAMGIPAFYTRTGLGTYVETGGFPIKFSKGGKEVEEYSKPKEKKFFNGREYLMEESIKGDFALIKAWKGDAYGNLLMRKTARNFNADMTGAARVTIVEVEEIVPVGELSGGEIHVPGILVNRIVKGEHFEHRHEKVVNTTPEGIKIQGAPVKRKTNAEQKNREKIAKRAAKELQNGWYVNLGIGIPMLVPSFLPEGVSIQLHSENGILGLGPYPVPGEEDPDLINAGKESVTALPGASFFSSSSSFGMYRGKHINATILGGMQVSKNGDIANWIIPGKLVKGMGGAMDLVSSGSKVVVCMEHVSKSGEPRILEKCSLPATGINCVSTLITDLAVFEFVDSDLVLREIASDSTLEEVTKKTGCSFKVADKLGSF